MVQWGHEFLNPTPEGLAELERNRELAIQMLARADGWCIAAKVADGRGDTAVWMAAGHISPRDMGALLTYVIERAKTDLVVTMQEVLRNDAGE